MRFNIGDTIRNKITQQEAPIVRIAETRRGMAYVVSVILSERWGGATKEVLWDESEVKRTGVGRVRS